MSAPTPRRSCPQHLQAPQASCPSCAAVLCLSAGGRAPAQKPRTEAERLRQYHQDPDVVAQRLRDHQVLLAQRCAPSQGWGPDRSIANRIIGGDLPSQLPSCYPYPTTVELDAIQLTAPEAQAGLAMDRPAPAPTSARLIYYQSQYVGQHHRGDDRGRTPSSNGNNYTYRPALQSIAGRSSYNSRNSGSAYHGGNNDENENEDSDEDDNNQS